MSLRFIDKYEIVSTLGRGSMGVVYKAKDPEIGRLVAIKTLKSVFMGDDAAGNEALARFRQESRSAGKLHHPNIVTIFEAGRTENGSPYIVMEYIEGKSLEAMIAEQGAVEPLAALHFLAQIASAIDYAHSQNVIHRDIKPSNIIVDSNFRPYLLDFGVAKLSDTSLTPAGTVVGTPSYMSPEQIRGVSLDGRTDIFSFAVVAFEMFTSRRPFPGADFTSVVSNIIHKEPLTFSELGSKLPESLEKVLQGGLAKDRDQRSRSALEFINTVAQTFQIMVDGTGLVGGYSPGLKFEDVLARETANRVRAHTVVGSFQPSDYSLPQADNKTALGRETENTASFPTSTLGSASTNFMGAAENVHSVSGVATSASQQSNTGGDSPYATAPRGQAIRAQDGERKRGRGLLGKSLLAIVVILGGAAGAGYWFRPELVEELVGQLEEQGLELFARLQTAVEELTAKSSSEAGPQQEESVANPAVAKPETSASPSSFLATADSLPAVNQPAVTQPASSAAVAEPTKSPEAASAAVAESSPAVLIAPTTAVADKPLLAVRPSITAESLSETSVLSLRDEEILWLLSSENSDGGSVRLAVNEAGKRSGESLTRALCSMATSGDFKVRIDALKALSKPGHVQTKSAMEIFLKSLNDSEFLVRGFAVKILSTVKTPEANEALKTRLGVEKNAVVLKVLNDALSQ